MENMKICTKCYKNKTIDQFYNKSTTKDGLDSHRKSCKKEYALKYQHQNRVEIAQKKKVYYQQNVTILNEKKKIYNAKNAHKHSIRKKEYYKNNKHVFLSNRLKKYNLTLETYNSLVDQQMGKCRICSLPPTAGRGKAFHVDHCHRTGKVRGLLCNYCNVALGHFKDNTEILKAAIRYLENGYE